MTNFDNGSGSRAKNLRRGLVFGAVVAACAGAWLTIEQVDSAETTKGRGATSAQSKSTRADSTASTATLDDALTLAQESRKAIDKLRDYTATFTKTEVVGDDVVVQTMDIKVRHEPFSAYLFGRQGQSQGREVIYVEGQNDGKLLARESGLKGLVGTVSLDPEEELALVDSRYPITEVGIAGILTKAVGVWENQKRHHPDNAEVRILEDTVGSAPCQVVQLSRRRSEPDSEFQLDRVYFDKRTKYTIKAQRYGWPKKAGEKAPLLEEYIYTDIKTNVGLTDQDFSTSNPNYRFGGSKLRLFR